MRSLLFVFSVISLAFAVWLQFRYKDANYPNTRVWQACLFISGFLVTTLGGVSLMYGADPRVILTSILLGGTFGGLIFAYASPRSMQGVYPKKIEEE